MRTWRGWSARSQVEWVELYTVQSLYLLTWLVSALLVLGASPSASDHPGHFAGLVLGTLVLTIAGTFLLRDAIRLYPASSPFPRSLAVVVVLCAVAEGLAFLLPEDLAFQAGLVVWSTLAWSVGGLRDRRVLAGLMVALTVVPCLPTLSPFGAVYGLLGGAFIVFTVRASLWLLGVVTELDRARNAQSALVLAEERLRFSRDVHDVLGRRLSTIAVQAELASTLSLRGDPSAAERMLDVRSAAHEAMREARELARGYRATNLAQELDGALSLLRSAGIGCRIDVTTLPPEWEEAAAWVVRETVTNVLRHSSAREVVIRYDGRSLIVRNDGVTSGADSEGAGLAGLRERLAPLGATLEAQRSGSDFEVIMTLPAGEGPA